MNKDYYNILGISKDDSVEEIKKAYKILVQQFHPDKNNGDDKNFKEINEAYRILFDPISRAKYDQNYSNKKDVNKSFKLDLSKEVNIKGLIALLFIILIKSIGYIIGSYLIAGIILTILFLVITPFLTKSFGKKLLYSFIIFVSLSVITVFTYAYINSNKYKNESINNKIENDLNLSIPENEYKPQNNNILNEKCVTEENTKICDLKFSTITLPNNGGYRDIKPDGNFITCVDMTTGYVNSNDSEITRASPNSSFCVSDWGNVYIDPVIEVKKYWNQIKRDNYNLPYKIDTSYDTCIWTYSDGNGNIPYIETLSNIGPRSGYSVKAFCKNGSNQVDIYSYPKDN